MGEYADEVLSGLRDEETGAIIDGSAPGFVRSGLWHPVSADERVRLPFGCPKCRKRFKHKGDLRQHIRGKHA